MVVLDHVRQAGVGHNTTQLIDWCWVMARRWRPLDPAEARAYQLTVEWLEAIYTGGESSRGRHIGTDDTLERWQFRMLDRFRRRI